MATVTHDTVIREEPISSTEETPKHLDSTAISGSHDHGTRNRSRHLQFDRTFITKPSRPGDTVNEEERSMLMTFVAFAIIVAISLLAVMALVNEGGSGSVTTFAEGVQTAITPNIQT